MRGAARSLPRAGAFSPRWRATPCAAAIDPDQCSRSAASAISSSMTDQMESTNELRQRIADYKRLQTMTWDKRALQAIAGIIAEVEKRLRQLEPPQVDGST